MVCRRIVVISGGKAAAFVLASERELTLDALHDRGGVESGDPATCGVIRIFIGSRSEQGQARLLVGENLMR